MSVRWCSGFLLLSVIFGCQGDISEHDVAGQTQLILNGEVTDDPVYSAVVALHSRFGSSVEPAPFCSGTVIAGSSRGTGGEGAVVLTAGQCVEGRGPQDVAVYFGCGPAGSAVVDPNIGCPDEGLVVATELEIHPNYNRRWLRNDIALVRLALPIEPCDAASSGPCATAVPSLPANWFNDDDLGSLPVNFAGFGESDVAGSFGIKLQLGDIPCSASSDRCFVLHSFGCAAFGCGPQESDEATKVSYEQLPPPEPGKGPCYGDSGGPMFVAEGAELYVGGVTSFGDSMCTEWGTSTRTDAFSSWISEFVGFGLCGDGTCSVDEDCQTCEADCGPCPSCAGNREVCALPTDCCSGKCKQGTCRGN